MQKHVHTYCEHTHKHSRQKNPQDIYLKTMLYRHTHRKVSLHSHSQTNVHGKAKDAILVSYICVYIHVCINWYNIQCRLACKDYASKLSDNLHMCLRYINKHIRSIELSYAAACVCVCVRIFVCDWMGGIGICFCVCH